MKHKKLYLVLGAEAVVIIALMFFKESFPAFFSSVLTFPFEQIALMLKYLSQTGRFGNAISVMLWSALSIIPAVYAINSKKVSSSERISLFIVSLALFIALAGMANPLNLARANLFLGAKHIKLFNAVLAASVRSSLLLFIVIRLLHLFKAGNTKQLLSYLKTLSYALCIVIVAAALLPVSDLMSNIVAEGTVVQYIFHVLKYSVKVIPYIMNIVVVIAVLNLIGAFEKEDTDRIIADAEGLSKKSAIALIVSTCVHPVYNLLQIVFMSKLKDVDTSVEVPLFSIFFVLLVLLFSRLIIENKRLKDENDLFV